MVIRVGKVTCLAAERPLSELGGAPGLCLPDVIRASVLVTGRQTGLIIQSTLLFHREGRWAFFGD